MKVITQNQLIEANEEFGERMNSLQYRGSDDFEGDSALAAKAALLRYAPFLVGRNQKPVQVEAYKCEGVSLEGVTPFEEVAFRGIFRATIAMRETETDATTGISLAQYGFMLRVEPEFDRVTDAAIKENAFILATFPHIERITLH